MPKIAKELTAIEVKHLKHPGRGRNAVFSVGGVSGLLLQINPNGARSWILRTTVGTKRRDIGLGGYPEVSLAKARDRAREDKEKIRNGVDPVAEREEARAKLASDQGRRLLFADAVEKCLDAKLDGFRNPKHRQQWRNTLATYAVPVLGKMAVDQIETQDVLRVLQPIWNEKTETAKRVRGRIEAVLIWATVAGHRKGDNPARWAGNLKELLPAPAKVAKKENQPAVALRDLPRWFAALRSREGMGARALKFLALTVVRSGEVRGATWDEFDLEREMWVIPASRMKKDREHRVPLSPTAMDLLKALPRLDGSPFLFPAPRGGQLSDMTLSGVMRRIHNADFTNGNGGFLDEKSKRPAVPHGLRSSFRDWVGDETHFLGDMAEVALAHKISSTVEAAYRRRDMLEKRRGMMGAWADFLSEMEPQSAEILTFGGSREV